uniref:Uncharacterized protein n=1 Tax=Suricata suricatta TaxID=37032 RepID=A0A673V3X8_SURSU
MQIRLLNILKKVPRTNNTHKNLKTKQVLYCCRTSGTVASWNIVSACPPLNLFVSDWFFRSLPRPLQNHPPAESHSGTEIAFL